MDHVKKQEPYKLQVLGVSENTTKDGLWSYMENISEKEVIDIEYLLNSRIVLVTLEEPTDLKKLQTKCSARSLDGNYLKVEHISTIMDLQESEECKVNGTVKDEAKDIRTDVKDIKNEDKDLMTFEPESENSKPNTSGNSFHGDILLSKSIVQILTSQDGSNYLEAKLKSLFGKVTFCKDESDETKLVLHASDQTHIDKAKDLIKKITTEEIISLHAQHKALLKSADFIIFDILEKFPLMGINHESDKVCFAGFKEHVDQAKSLLSAHFQEKAIEQRHAIRAGYEKQNEFLIRFKEAELKKIENSLKDESVKFGFRNTLCEITIAGTQKGGETAHQELMQLIEEIKEKTIEVKNSETNKLLKKKGQLEKDCKCIIEVTECPTNMFADTSSKIKQGVRILIIKDDIAKEKVDAIVNTISPDLDLGKNASAKALSDAAGPELQQELKLNGNMSVGGMIVTSGYNLECKKVFHVCPGIPTQEKVLRSLVVQCLEEAHKRRFSSIAFPAIGTGHLGFPRDLVAKIFFEEVDKFKKKNPKTLILEVHFTLFDGDQATIDAFEKEEANIIQRQNAVGGVDKLIFPQIIEGDIAKEKADVIVNTVNADFDLSKNPCAKALSDAAGKGLQEECKKMKIGPGQIKVTGGHNLFCKNVFHVVFGKQGEKVLRSLVSLCLKEADERRFSSIAFPAIGTGNIGFPRDIVARAFFEEVHLFRKSNPDTSLVDVRFVLFYKDKLTIQAFKAEEQKWPKEIVKEKQEPIRGDSIMNRNLANVYYAMDQFDDTAAILSGGKYRKMFYG